MKGAYRSRSRIVMDLLTAIKAEGPVGVSRLLVVANLTHAKLQGLLSSFEADGWVVADRATDRIQWTMAPKGDRVLSDLRRVDAVMQDHGLGV